MMKKMKIFIILIIFCVIIIAGIYLIFFQKGEVQNKIRNTNDDILYYTCGMHPSVRILPQDYTEDTLCPICNMKLTPVYSEETRNQKPETRGEITYYGCGIDSEGKCPRCDAAEADARCICGKHSFILVGQEMNCPVCAKPLRPLTQEEVDRLKGVLGRVRIRGEQIYRAGIKTEPVRRLRLFKEIRTVGQVAYDPELAVAQEEFISSLKALERIKKGDIPEIKQRAENLVHAAERKLLLLGLSPQQIQELADKREVQKSLILPEEKMWIYGEVYEYELAWVKPGERIEVTTASLPGEEFRGVISSVNPVVNPRTRAIRFRAQVDNPDLKLKPQMYVDVLIQSEYIGSEGEQQVLAIPKDAVLDTGRRKIVWVEKGSGEFVGRLVQVGPEATAIIANEKMKFYPVLAGLSEGELIVTKANFLIDSQSQITGVAASAYGGALGIEE